MKLAHIILCLWTTSYWIETMDYWILNWLDVLITDERHYFNSQQVAPV